MAYERRRRSHAALNLTPLIDVVFLLLVFFMLTAHFVRDEALKIELPEAENTIPLQDEVAVEVVIDAGGRILLSGEPVAPDALQGVLYHALQRHKEKWVTIRGDRQADLGVAVTVLDAARRAGAESVDIVTERP